MAERVVIVEDNERNQRLAAAVLEMAGVEVTMAATGGAAIHLCLADPPDGVLLDLQLPDVGGDTVLHELRADARTADVPVIAVTAFAMEGDRQRCLELGFDGYLTKPIDVGTFAGSVREIISNRVRS
jgi:two-component system cell cycle response regulator DivK